MASRACAAPPAGGWLAAAIHDRLLLLLLLRPPKRVRAARCASGTARAPALSKVRCPALVRTRSELTRSSGERFDGLSSAAERFAAELEGEAAFAAPQVATRATELTAAEARLAVLQTRIDALYCDTFANAEVPEAEASEPSVVTEAAFSKLGRDAPAQLTRLMAAVASRDRVRYNKFQAEAQQLALRRDAARREVGAASAALVAAQQALYKDEKEVSNPAVPAVSPGSTNLGSCIVLICGFEQFNVGLYKSVAKRLTAAAPSVRLLVFSDRDIDSRRADVEAALACANAVVVSLLFDYDQSEWLRERLRRVPVRLAFECSLELMSMTQVGTFTMAGTDGGQSRGPPPAVKALLAKFGSGREEDKMLGYLSMLKVMPSLLRFVPGTGARHLRNWVTIYSSWNAGGADNVLRAFLHLSTEYLGAAASAQAGAALAAVEVPSTGCFHPTLAVSGRYITSPREYLAWYARTYAPSADAPVVAVLLYRKHVVSQLPYLAQLVTALEEDGVVPLPIFISGVEAHAVVRDSLTSRHEAAQRAAGNAAVNTLRPDAAVVDAVVSTIGFPLCVPARACISLLPARADSCAARRVGGPAGSMEGGRQADVAQAILAAKNVPYFVAAPLLIQDLASWSADGVAALQSVVLYALPELDAAIDVLPLGGLVGDDVYLCRERVGVLAARIRAWVELRRRANADKRVAVVLYGFPPGAGAVGTAALLNVPASLEATLARLASEGYDLGSGALPSGETIVAALTALEAAPVAARGLAGAAAALAGRGVDVAGQDVSAATLRSWLTLPDTWGPGEWGPVPTLPPPDLLVSRMERAWGSLDTYTGIRAAVAAPGGGPGVLSVAGLRLGNIFIGVQPSLGIEGDPMRLLFERDLTPHVRAPPARAARRHCKQAAAARGAAASARLDAASHCLALPRTDSSLRR